MYKVWPSGSKLEASKWLESMLLTVMEGPGGGAAERIRGIDFAVGSLTTHGSGEASRALFSVWTSKWRKSVRMLERDLGVF